MLLSAGYVPTPHEVVNKMLELACIKECDVIYDLGCGDGRVVITAAREYHIYGVGIDIDPNRIEWSYDSAREAGVEDRVRFIQQDFFESDLRNATIVTLYLPTKINRRLLPKMLKELKSGSRIISHHFDFGTWPPDASVRVPGQFGERKISRWVIPNI
jgi:SAM-dependent methyltransferase